MEGKRDSFFLSLSLSLSLLYVKDLKTVLFINNAKLRFTAIVYRSYHIVSGFFIDLLSNFQKKNVINIL